MSLLSDMIIYLKMSVRDFARNPGPGSLASYFRYFRSWRKFHAPDRNSVADSMPWISFSAIDFLRRRVVPDQQAIVPGQQKIRPAIFEYGSGGSTLFWTTRARELVSVEHDGRWFGKMQEELERRHISNTEYLFREAVEDPAFAGKDYRNPDDDISSDPNYAGKNFKDYVSAIDRYPDEHFDIIVVDGRARPSCIKHSIGKLKPNGWLIVDNTEREHYLSPFRFNRADWEIHHFGGPVPYIWHFSTTTLLRKKSPLTNNPVAAAQNQIASGPGRTPSAQNPTKKDRS